MQQTQKTDICRTDKILAEKRLVHVYLQNFARADVEHNSTAKISDQYLSSSRV